MAAIAAVLLALTEVFVDWLTRIDLNIAIVYGLPLVIIAAARSRRLLWGLWLFLFMTTFAVYYVQIPHDVFSFREPRFVNRVLCGVALVLTASLLHLGLIAADILDAQRRSLEAQNEELERRRRDAEKPPQNRVSGVGFSRYSYARPYVPLNG